ncbi:MAG: type II toxin-antitoxin system Phd/YefM family antitoxin [Pseudomonadota bacterium]|nr:type II toxin-antitoxin system Phd/YefM family antitoxin [Pseudomonadota bacterium]
MMKTPHISEDILPLGQFKTRASEVLRRLRNARRPIVITQNGKPAAVLIAPEDFDRLVEREQFLTAVQEGLADLEAGRWMDDAALSQELDKELGPVQAP